MVSQDCGHTPTADAIASYGNKVTHIKVSLTLDTHTHNLHTLTTHTPSQQPDLSEPKIPVNQRSMKNTKAEIGYIKISRHYKWALTQIFDVMDYEYTIIVEGEWVKSHLTHPHTLTSYTSSHTHTLPHTFTSYTPSHTHIFHFLTHSHFTNSRTDDLLVAPDFFSYFQSLRPVMDSDPSIWCVSAWNDNGKKGFIDTTANGL